MPHVKAGHPLIGQAPKPPRINLGSIRNNTKDRYLAHNRKTTQKWVVRLEGFLPLCLVAAVRQSWPSEVDDAYNLLSCDSAHESGFILLGKGLDADLEPHAPTHHHNRTDPTRQFSLPEARRCRRDGASGHARYGSLRMRLSTGFRH